MGEQLGKNIKKKVVAFRYDPDLFHRAGTRLAYRKRFADALRYLNKAVDMEPFNADYKFNLACVLAELKETEKSTEILADIIKNIDPTFGECYFGMGCNYFDIGNFKKSREYFEKYIYYDPDGQFVDEAYDILYYLQIYDAEFNFKRSRIISKLILQGKKLLDEGLYKKACLKLEKAVEIDPEMIVPRNYLALSCYLSGEVERAICLARSVLKLEADNAVAHCNLALFFAGKGCMDLYYRQLKILSKIKIKNKENCLCEMKQFLKVASNDKKTSKSLKADIVGALNLGKQKPRRCRKKPLNARRLNN